NKHFISRGHYGKAFSGYGFGNEQKSLNISGEWESKKLNWESYRQANAILSANIINDFITATSNTIVSTRQDDLYVLESVTPEKQRSSYQRLDKQYRKRLNTDLNVMFSLGNSIGLTLYDSYSLQNYELQMNKSRNTGDYNNLAQISFSYYPVPNIELKSVNSHNYYIKDLSSIKNTRIIDTRKTSNSIIWGYNNADTLSINYTVELKRTMYPDSGNDMDNDYLSNNYRASWIIFYKDRIRISNHLLYIINDEIFIASELSANNNQSTSLQWQPECDILIGDCLMLMQDYQIRADYDNYYYSQTFSNIRDTFYRFVSCGYNLVYDTTPLAAKSIYTNWNNLPYRNRNSNAFRFELSYNWERNETSAQENGVYYINDTEERQAIGTVIQKQFGIGIYQLQPKYSWGYWKEYSMLLSALWQLNKNSSTEFIINPIGPDFNNLDWKISCSINLLF
ncbi:MAG: hypothetical protein FJ041_03260, partial [Candidatus Cloacimonetes bacterium]|nr:hypothetical protein [Candidatus Cloacimonadota bacterium]